MIFGALETENIDCDYGQKVLIFGAPGTENIDFLMLWGKKILIFVALGHKVFIFGVLRTENH